MRLIALAVLLLASLGARAEDVYQTPEAFVAEAFGGRAPAAQVLWLNPERKAQVRAILGHDLPALRVRYWREGERSAWILEEIGKERLITTGYVVEAGALARVKVLIYRESRGFEVRHPFFTDQFKGARLRADQTLDRHIDGISGATLSVDALTRLARLALYFHQQAMNG